MTNKEILKKAIEKAVKNGWNPIPYIPEHTPGATGDQLIKLLAFNYYKFIFSHSFAKAFWGEEEIKYLPLNFVKAVDAEEIAKNFLLLNLKSPAWEYHLKQMVLEEDPIKYLEQFLKEK
jgi:hypothetical protein